MSKHIATVLKYINYIRIDMPALCDFNINVEHFRLFKISIYGKSTYKFIGIHIICKLGAG